MANLAIIKQNAPGDILQLVTPAQQKPHLMVPYFLKFITYNDLLPTTGVDTHPIRYQYISQERFTGMLPYTKPHFFSYEFTQG